ncbi:MAG: hypothetical protein ACK521_06680 [bacterium]
MSKSHQNLPKHVDSRSALFNVPLSPQFTVEAANTDNTLTKESKKNLARA